jgi:CPA1 family monovalent cation:H+ antiporter
MELAVLLAEESRLIIQEISFVILVAIAALVAVIIRRIRLPYTVALVIAGLILSFLPGFLNVDFIGSELILALLVPPLLFEATLHIQWVELKRNLIPVLLLATVGSLIGTFIVGGIVLQVLDIPLAAAIVFGALISATDPVAVIAFFRSLGVSKRLALLVEGESLFNDGVAVVIFSLALTAGTAASFSLQGAILEFGRVAFGGLAVGLILGYVVSHVVLKNVDDHLIETATTVALAFGAFVVAEEFALSGILSVVAAGLMVGNIGLQSTSPTTRITLENFWEFMSFVVNSLIFLVIGLKIGSADLPSNILFPTAVAVIAVLLSRAILVYGLTWLNNRLYPPTRIEMSYRHVMFWGGLRGAISLALVLTLTGNVLGSEIALQFQVMTFGVVLFTLLVQGTTIERLINRLGLARMPTRVLEQQEQQARLYAKWSGKQELDRMHQKGILFRDTWEAMSAVYEEEIDELKRSLREHLLRYPELEQEMFLHTRMDVLRAERSALTDALRRGLISDNLYHQLILEADRRSAALEVIQARLGVSSTEIELSASEVGD